MMAVLLMLAIAAIRLWPEALVSRLATRLAIRPIAAWLNRLDRRHLIFALLIAIAILGAGELLAALGPLDVGLVLMWDVASVADALIATALAASVVRLRPLRLMVGAALARLRPRRRERRTKRISGDRRRASNDADDPAIALAA